MFDAVHRMSASSRKSISALDSTNRDRGVIDTLDNLTAALTAVVPEAPASAASVVVSIGQEGTGAVTLVFDCSDPIQRERGLGAAIAAVRRRELVVIPTDTLYGLGVDAFAPDAVDALLATK